MSKKRLGLIVSILALLGLIALIPIKFHQPDPTYEGIHLSEWLVESAKANFSTKEDAQIHQRKASLAIKHSGTNAVPTLLRMIRAREHPVLNTLYLLISKLPFGRIDHVSPSSLQIVGMKGFQELGPAASNAVLELIDIVDHSPSSMSKQAAIASLKSIGSSANESAPSLLRATESTNQYVRAHALAALYPVHVAPELAVPKLINALDDPTQGGRTAAAIGLAQYGTNAQSAVPALVVAYNKAKDSARSSGETVGPGMLFQYALRQIDKDSAAQLREESAKANPAADTLRLENPE